MQHDQNPAKLTFIKADPRDMNQPIAQNKPSSPLNQKHSAGSESSSETNLESEHADVVGTPLMTADTSDAGVHVGSTDEGKGEGKEAMSKDQTKVSLVENMTSDSASPVTKRPQTNKQRTYLFPEKVIRYVRFPRATPSTFEYLILMTASYLAVSSSMRFSSRLWIQ
ncbi:hypothetical protein QFC19_002754 [Naganishia cerealis]|uniref:Uncharacterized protein n=1 Tax=Naganishia cerealis TaxID=610337 RepID=A0ACC2W8T3_9TREE|nr:hypothetical protein QFC19_002754 [Naganishia cerealis]